MAAYEYMNACERTVTITAASAVAYRDVLEIGTGNVGVVLGDAEAGAPVALAVDGDWIMPKLTTDVMGVGATVYYDAGNDRLTNAATNNTPAGVVLEAAGNGATEVKVALVFAK